MTKKDYELIAEAIRDGIHEHKRVFGEPPHHHVQVLTERIADALARDNPRFQRRRFLDAAGVTDAPL